MAYKCNQKTDLHRASAAFKTETNDYTKSGKFYTTPEINREIVHLDNGVNHMRLDHDFIGSSQEWSGKWKKRGSDCEKAASERVIYNATGTVNHLRKTMPAREITGLQDNEVRQRHHDGMNRLVSAEREMGPYANLSINRLKQYCDHVGVSDRYTGYRNNLNRGSRDPVRIGFSWMEAQHMYDPSKGSTIVTPRPSNNRCNSAAVDKSWAPMTIKDNGKPNPYPASAPYTRKTIQEQCGINTTFPGKSECMVRYFNPDRESSTVQTLANPQPRMDVVGGRPLGQTSLGPRVTEYQWRYNWPETSQITQLPWTRN